MRDRLQRFSTFHGEWGIDFGGVTVRDEPNWPVSDLDMHRMPDVVEDLAGKLTRGLLAIYLGGDNAITRPLGQISVSRAHSDRDSSPSTPTTMSAPSTSGRLTRTPVRGLIEGRATR